MTFADRAARGASDTLRADDGYFGPGSVSWRVFADPVAKLGGMAALLLQALNPYMMRLFYHATASHNDAAGRDERTGRYFDTVVFGDRAHADAAAASVRRMHAHAAWDDPHSGQILRADNPEWLAWTHNTFVYALVLACEAFGVPLTAEEKDRFVIEQHAAARLIGIEDDALLPSTFAELVQYVDAQRGWLSLSIEAAEVTRGLRKPSLRGNPIAVWSVVIVQDGVLSLLPDWARLLYGIEGRPMNLRAAARTTRRLMGLARRSRGYSALISDAVTRVDDHPYRKVRSR
ncbi:oxygenase MpaB family protein [Microbacterium sp. 18062]|uniref:oxygenase MpaB family protein n=1 Tax=Microbacterium sp. 18062 TaxID=2681410 RepID=UPI001F27D8BF|nr:oxygenase MpaB family protein [Microbacterium sp. 18062]